MKKNRLIIMLGLAMLLPVAAFAANTANHNAVHAKISVTKSSIAAGKTPSPNHNAFKAWVQNNGQPSIYLYVRGAFRTQIPHNYRSKLTSKQVQPYGVAITIQGANNQILYSGNIYNGQTLQCSGISPINQSCQFS